ncbi:MAG: bifunctional phosphopantothenoylcysteine decarboxylase/phosphopantothenate--cysteine ligase CoaBC [Chloroflexi bacterium]|nr:bifunctional phosphopantothenoylcysteine decarboxylase/phosphopantothenate--cysteine ligase CoaBC [Chloroflexota bacterium]
MLKGKFIVLGVTGSIAAFKGAELASKLTQAGALVDVIMTKSAMEFIAPLTFRSLTHRPVATDLFAPDSELSLEHVALAERADVMVVAPATANFIAKLALGLADDLLSCTILATKAPVIVVPAMDSGMYENPVTQENVAKLRSRDFVIAGPTAGHLASGISGMGRMLEVEELLGIVRQVLGRKGDLRGKKIVVTAGGTQEPIDPVRHISNRSSGKMGYALVEAARDRGATVTLIATPVALKDPAGVEVVHVNTASEMREAVLKACSGADALLMAAAVADYAPIKPAGQKIKKGQGTLILELKKTPDILSEVKGKIVKVGFAAESENLVANAQKKLRQKKLDFIVANDITSKGSGFASDTNRVTIINRAGKAEDLPLMLKTELAGLILDSVAKLLKRS